MKKQKKAEPQAKVRGDNGFIVLEPKDKTRYSRVAFRPSEVIGFGELRQTAARESTSSYVYMSSGSMFNLEMSYDELLELMTTNKKRKLKN